MAKNDSKTQVKQEQENWKNKTQADQEGVVDKKLDGPNRPAE